ncbi:MAG: hypothetical protein HQL14_00355 [Candidatus Omnitrophica bacterium]|nr:hypothetical protein [Candidatus Omnitrophota bacterium]
MRRRVLFFIFFAMVVCPLPSLADTAGKFQGGFKDLMMAPLQVGKNVKTETANAKFLPFALAGGFLKGTFYMAKQMVTGTLNMVTSPLDNINK